MDVLKRRYDFIIMFFSLYFMAGNHVFIPVSRWTAATGEYQFRIYFYLFGAHKSIEESMWVCVIFRSWIVQHVYCCQWALKCYEQTVHWRRQIEAIPVRIVFVRNENWNFDFEPVDSIYKYTELHAQSATCSNENLTGTDRNRHQKRHKKCIDYY